MYMCVCVCVCVSIQALFGTLTPDVMLLTIAYSIAGLGIAIVNDFKSIEGDRYVHTYALTHTIAGP